VIVIKMCERLWLGYEVRICNDIGVSERIGEKVLKIIKAMRMESLGVVK
jgi:hypothetical protein